MKKCEGKVAPKKNYNNNFTYIFDQNLFYILDDFVALAHINYLNINLLIKKRKEEKGKISLS